VIDRLANACWRYRALFEFRQLGFGRGNFTLQPAHLFDVVHLLARASELLLQLLQALPQDIRLFLDFLIHHKAPGLK
jgi:hypothetical protein